MFEQINLDEQLNKLSYEQRNWSFKQWRCTHSKCPESKDPGSKCPAYHLVPILRTVFYIRAQNHFHSPSLLAAVSVQNCDIIYREDYPLYMGKNNWMKKKFTHFLTLLVMRVLGRGQNYGPQYINWIHLWKWTNLWAKYWLNCNTRLP